MRKAAVGPTSIRAAFIAAFVAVAWVYVWTSRSNNLGWDFGAGQKDYYNLLVDGFLAGKLSLNVDVPPELLAASDPYDPALRPPGLALHDASLFRGRYYIYFGVVPAVLVLLPFRLITGFGLPLPIAVLGFLAASYAVSLALAVDVRRRFFPRCGPVTLFLLAVVLGFASCAPVLLRRSSMYELPIASGSFFALAALGALYVAWIRPSRALMCVAVSSACWGLAIGSRPTYVLAPLVLLTVRAALGRNADPVVARRERVRLWVAAIAPLGIIGCLLGWYNYARFGDPTEFGLRYILSGVYEAKAEHFRLRYVPWNLYAYLVAPGEWGRYFPFFHELPITVPKPERHFGMDHPFGLLASVPLVWLAWFAVRPVRGGSDADVRPLRALVRALAGTTIAVAAVLLGFYAAMARYLGDFAPALAVLGVVGAMAFTQQVRSCLARWRRALGAFVIGAFAVFSVAGVFLFSVQLHDQVRKYNPAAFAALARWADAPTHRFEALRGPPPGALLLRVTFPMPGADREREELVRTGWSTETDRLFVRYPDAGHVQFEYEHAGAPPVRGAMIAVDRSVEHRVRIAMGSLFPPASWPGYDEWSDGERLGVLRRVAATVDEAPAIERYQRCYDASAGTIVIGGTQGSVPFGGRVIEVRREPVREARRHALVEDGRWTPRRAPTDGPWRLAVRFPDAAAGRREPLVVSGETGRGDFLAVEYLGDRRIRFVLDHWGSRALFSAPLWFDPQHEYRIEVRHPAHQAQAAGVNLRGELRVTMDDRVVWTAAALLYPITPEDVFFGINPIGGSSCGERFTGTIRVVPGGAR